MTDSLIRLLAKVLIRFHLLKKMIIVRVDGGICSQMHFFLIGQQLKENGFLVKYDLDWFKNNGKDLTGKFARNFDLLKAFPDLDVCVAKKYEIHQVLCSFMGCCPYIVDTHCRQLLSRLRQC